MSRCQPLSIEVLVWGVSYLVLWCWPSSAEVSTILFCFLTLTTHFSSCTTKWSWVGKCLLADPTLIVIALPIIMVINGLARSCMVALHELIWPHKMKHDERIWPHTMVPWPTSWHNYMMVRHGNFIQVVDVRLVTKFHN